MILLTVGWSRTFFGLHFPLPPVKIFPVQKRIVVGKFRDLAVVGITRGRQIGSSVVVSAVSYAQRCTQQAAKKLLAQVRNGGGTTGAPASGNSAAVAADSRLLGASAAPVGVRVRRIPRRPDDMTSARYRLSFTTGGLMVREAGVAVPLFLQLGDWVKVRDAIESENLLQARTVSSSQRIARELVQRLAELDEDELVLLTQASGAERGCLMWAAACRRYQLLGEFAEEVLRERFLLLAQTLEQSDFDSFIRARSIWHEELAALKDSTYRKLRSNVFLMMREAGLLSDDGRIVPTTFSESFAAVLTNRVGSDIRFFPSNDPIFRGAK